MANIVIVDDSRLVKKMLSQVLTEIGHNILADGKDGLEGVELYREHRPDLLLLDITMPNMSGKECLEVIMGEFPEARVVMFTSVSDSNSLKECLDIGAKSYLKKDTNLMDQSNIDEIRQLVDSALKD